MAGTTKIMGSMPMNRRRQIAPTPSAPLQPKPSVFLDVSKPITEGLSTVDYGSEEHMLIATTSTDIPPSVPRREVLPPIEPKHVIIDDFSYEVPDKKVIKKVGTALGNGANLGVVSDDDVEVALASLDFAELTMGDEDERTNAGTTIEDALFGNNLVFLSRNPVKGWRDVDGTRVDFEYDQVLFYDLDDEDYGVLAAPCEREENSLEQLIACRDRVAEGGNNCLPVYGNFPFSGEHNLFLVNLAVATRSKGTRVILNYFQGGMAQPMLVYNVLEDRMEVLKPHSEVLDPSKGGRDVGRDILRNEAGLMKALKGKPRILQIYDHLIIDDGSEEGLEVLVEEYCGIHPNHLVKGFVQQYIAEKEQEGHSNKLNNFFKLILEEGMLGIKSCHEERIAHVDLKPENILWTLNEAGEPEARLMDFGISTSYQEARNSNRIAFTPFTVEPALLIPYIYTELYMGRSDLSRVDYETHSDIYSFGRTLLDKMSLALSILAGEESKDDPDRDTQVKPIADLDSCHKHCAPHITINTVEGLVRENQKDISKLQRLNMRLGKPFSEEVFDLLEELTAPRTERIYSHKAGEMATIHLEERYSFAGVSELKQDTPDEINPYYEFKPSDMEDVNLILAQTLLTICEDLDDVHNENRKRSIDAEVYLDMEYKKGGDINLEGRMELDSAKRHPEPNFDNLSIMEPDAMIAYFGAHACAAHAKTEDARSYIQREARFDYEKETNIYQLGRVLVQAMADKLGVKLTHERVDRFSERMKKYMEQFTSQLYTKSCTDLQKREPVNQLRKMHLADVTVVKKANEAQEMFDPAFLTLADQMTKYRMEGRMDLPEVMGYVSDFIEDYSAKMQPASAPRMGETQIPVLPVQPTEPTPVLKAPVLQDIRSERPSLGSYSFSGDQLSGSGRVQYAGDYKPKD